MPDKLDIILGEKVGLFDLSNTQRAKLIFAISAAYSHHLSGFQGVRSLQDLQNKDFGRWKAVAEESTKVTYSGISPNTECLFLASCSVAEESWNLGQEAVILLSEEGKIVHWNHTFCLNHKNYYHRISKVSIFSLPSIRIFSQLLQETGSTLREGVVSSLFRLSEELQTQRNQEREDADRLADKIGGIRSRMTF
jgi:hypothetical protein